MGFKEKLYKATHDLADRRFSDWTPPVNGSSTFRKPVRIKTTEDVASLATLLAPEGERTEIRVGNEKVTAQEVASMSPARFTSITISSYPADGAPSGNMGFAAQFQISPHVTKGVINAHGMGTESGTGSFMTVQVPPAEHRTTETITLDKAKDVAMRCTEVVPRKVWKGPYSVVNRITVETEDQRNHDRKIRKQSALISLGISLGVAVLSFLLNLPF